MSCGFLVAFFGCQHGPPWVAINMTPLLCVCVCVCVSTLCGLLLHALVAAASPTCPPSCLLIRTLSNPNPNAGAPCCSGCPGCPSPAWGSMNARPMGWQMRTCRQALARLLVAWWRGRMLRKNSPVHRTCQGTHLAGTCTVRAL